MKSMARRILKLMTILTGILVLTGIGFTQTVEPSVKAVTTAVNGDALTLVLTKPAGTAAGEVLVAQVTYEKGLDALPISAPSGWTPILTTNAYEGGGNQDLGQALYFKVATANEPAAYLWTFAQKVKALGGISLWQGVDNTQPLLASSGLGGYGDSTGKNQLVGMSVAGVPGSKLVAFYGIKEMAFLQLPAGMQRVYQAWDRDNGYSVMVSAEGLQTEGATGERVARSWEDDRLSASVESKWVAQMIVLKPSAGSVQPQPVTAGQQLRLWGLIEGDSTGLAEDRHLTRSEMMVIFSRMMGRFNEARAYAIPAPFSDTGNHWARAYVSYGYSQGWTSGMGNNQFGYDLRHTSQQAAVFMMKALGYKADVDFTWNNVFQKAVELGLFEGVSIKPGDQILRGDLFKVMVKTLNTNSVNDTQPLGRKLGIF